MSKLEYVLQLIQKERIHQNALKAAGKFEYTPADKECPEGTRLAVLVEEVGEVARAICEDDERNKFEELVQVAAVCVAWLEHMTGNETITNLYDERTI